MDSIICELKDNIDKLVVIHLTCTCLTGLVVGVSDDACKIVSRNACRGVNRVTVCRLDDIQAVTFCQ